MCDVFQTQVRDLRHLQIQNAQIGKVDEPSRTRISQIVVFEIQTAKFGQIFQMSESLVGDGTGAEIQFTKILEAGKERHAFRGEESEMEVERAEVRQSLQMREAGISLIEVGKIDFHGGPPRLRVVSLHGRAQFNQRLDRSFLTIIGRSAGVQFSREQEDQERKNRSATIHINLMIQGRCRDHETTPEKRRQNDNLGGFFME